MNKTAVYLTDQEAKLYTTFMRHFELIKRMDELGVFGLCDGKVEILLDGLGRVGDIFIHTRHKSRLVID